ncbi:MAG TPA: 50S ribosomal protein L31e [Candidatus Nanoarchaeia archaeon]|nr:50S ribosomal protein L31e [Candidatus Nanoarchaeia archaeon]
MATVERTITINLRKEIQKAPPYKRAKKAITAIREHLQQHMKASRENVKIGKYLNLKIWEHGIKRPAHRITVLVKKDDKGVVTAELPNIPVKKKGNRETKYMKEAKKTEKEKSAKPAEKGEEKEKAAVATAATANATVK